MKKLLFLIPLIAIAASPTTSPTVVDIDTAMKNGQVRVTALSNGSYYDESVELKVTNLRGQKLTVRIPPGFLFHPADDGEQTLITTEEQLLTVEPRANAEKVLRAYCCEPGDLCPSEASAFRLERSTHPGITKMNEYLKTHRVSDACIQDAVWSVTGQRPLSNITVETPEDHAFRRFLSELTGLENPWYTSPQNRQSTPGREIVSSTVKIEGELRLDIPRNCEVYQDIRDKDGNSKVRNVRYFSMPKGEDIRFGFRIQVTGWAKGDYDVYLLTKQNEELAHYTFSV